MNKIYATPPEARLIVSFYDSDYDRNLNYTEFLNLILSDSNFTVRKNPREKCAYKRGFPMSYTMEHSLLKLLEKELELAREVEIIVGEIKNRIDYNLLDIHALIQGPGTNISQAR